MKSLQLYGIIYSDQGTGVNMMTGDVNMSLGRNISFSRRQKKLTQEQFAEMMKVTRQTVSRWEADEVTPELNKLVDMCSVFSCKLDELVRDDMSAKGEIYSEVGIRRVPSFTMARYVMISREPESDVQNYMKNWGIRNGLLAAFPDAKLIGWDFPFVTQEQQVRFGLHGYAAAYVLPEGFECSSEGVEYAKNSEADYAVITVTEPFVQPFERIPLGYKHIMDYLNSHTFKDKRSDDILGCFEHEYVKDGVTYMDIYVHAANDN